MEVKQNGGKMKTWTVGQMIVAGAVFCGLMMGTGCATTKGEMSTAEDIPPEGYSASRLLLEDEPAEVTRWVPSEDFPELKISQRGLDITTKFEGFVAKMYNDPVGLCTVGYGHLIKKAPCDGTEPKELQRVTRESGAALLKKDMAKAERAVMALVTKPLNQNQFDVMCDFVYNAGAGNLKKSNLLKVLNAGELDKVPSELRRWTKAGGKTLNGLVKRREAEIELFTEGTLIPRSVPNADDMLPEIDLDLGE